ncbi:hypothetical protein A3K79_05270 [Candidatus Bathyarchaeota archaeon RBG_13_46_16b]|nr:MAG: hypothetical protein A3K79_05270 [Candidatus Bathyarchaeota archaeon RBG_13_46_16b]
MYNQASMFEVPVRSIAFFVVPFHSALPRNPSIVGLFALNLASSSVNVTAKALSHANNVDRRAKKTKIVKTFFKSSISYPMVGSFLRFTVYNAC